MSATNIDRPWQYHDKFTAMLNPASPDERAGLHAAVKGVEKIIRAAVENRGGIEISGKRLVRELTRSDRR